jgi:hypothetical protein
MSPALIRLVDEGSTWTANYNATEAGYLSDLAVDPDDPDVVLAAGGVLFRSTDGGAHFAPCGPWWTDIVLFHPEFPTVVFAGGLNKNLYLHESRDRGITWRQISGYPDWQGHGALCIEPDPQSPRVAWVGTRDGVLRLQTPEVLPPTPTPSPTATATPTPTPTPTASPLPNARCGEAWSGFE